MRFFKNDFQPRFIDYSLRRLVRVDVGGVIPKRPRPWVSNPIHSESNSACENLTKNKVVQELHGKLLTSSTNTSAVHSHLQKSVKRYNHET